MKLVELGDSPSKPDSKKVSVTQVLETKLLAAGPSHQLIVSLIVHRPRPQLQHLILVDKPELCVKHLLKAGDEYCGLHCMRDFISGQGYHLSVHLLYRPQEMGSVP